MPSRKGFTLIELMVALVVGAMVLVGARDLLAELTATAHDIRRRGNTVDRAANQGRVLRELLGNVEVGTKESTAFIGTADSATFSSWCATPAGWLERCTVVLGFAAPASEGISQRREVVARVDGRTMELGDPTTRPRMLYLASGAGGGRWLDRWPGGVSAPLAIGILGDADTLIVRVGGI